MEVKYVVMCGEADVATGEWDTFECQDFSHAFHLAQALSKCAEYDWTQIQEQKHDDSRPGIWKLTNTRFFVKGVMLDNRGQA